MNLPKLMFRGKEVGAEGIIIFGIVGYETVALATNVATGKRTIPPITDMLGPMSHHRYGKIFVWLFLGWCWDHFYRRGEREFFDKMTSAQKVAAVDEL